MNREEEIAAQQHTAVEMTVLAVLAAQLVHGIYLLLDRNPCFACIGAMFGVGMTLGDGRLAGGGRAWGTLLGGLTVLLVYPLYHGTQHIALRITVMAAGMLLILAVGHRIGRIDITRPAAVIYYVVLFTVGEAVFTSYTTARILDTFIGAGAGIGLNALYFLVRRRRAASSLQEQ